MKNILLLFVFLLSFGALKAQDTLCTVVINQIQGGFCLQASATGTAPFTYWWSNGDIGDTVCPNDTITSYCVTVIDADSCVSTACATLNNNNNCSVTISDLGGSPLPVLVATPSGSGSYNFQWTTGETTNTITPAQPGDYCVTIWDSLGCQANDCYTWIGNPLDSCEVDISLDPNGGLTATHLGTAPFTYLWDTNETTATIYPSANGVYCVTATDALGCVTTACRFWSLGTNDSCAVYIEEVQNGSWLNAVGSGVGPYSYEWSSGETTSSIALNQVGLYCVTLTDNFGCVASSCYNTLDSCDVDISLNPNGGLTATHLGSGPFTYLWDTNETTATIYPSANGVYCVTATDATGCVATACRFWSMGTQDSCSVYIQEVQNGSWLNAVGSGVGPYSYEWSSGETTSSIALSQVGLYCVTLTDNLGCVASSCYNIIDSCEVDINLNPNGGLTATHLGTGPFTYEWDNNQIGATIYPSTNGLYCVTATDALGCVATSCQYWSMGTQDSCSVDIQEVQNGAWLNAIVSGTGPYSYQWTTGETTSSIMPTQNGNYCVTIWDTIGCQADACYTWMNNTQDSCYATIIYNPMDTAVNLYAQAQNGTAPYTYLWNNGSTNPAIWVDSTMTGTYCVEITDALGCVANACFNLTGLSYTIQGDILLPNIDSLINVPLEAVVYLIQFDPVDNSLTAIDTLLVTGFPNSNSLYYAFHNLPAGNYLVKAALTPNSNGYSDHLPTYHGDVLFWDEATEITLPDAPNVYLYNIQMIEGDNPGGPGFIGGLVSEGANLTGGATPRGEGDPIENASIFLLDENDQAVAYAYTAADGSFSFDGLPWGTYKVYIEILGLEPVFTWVTIGPDNQTIDNVVFVVNSTEIETVVTGIAEVVDTQSLLVFPNPASGEVNLQLEAKTDTEALLWITNLQGQRVLTKPVQIIQGSQYLQLDVSALAQGMYFLNLQIKEEVLSQKLIKK